MIVGKLASLQYPPNYEILVSYIGRHMKYLLFLFCAIFCGEAFAVNSIYDLSVKDISGKATKLSVYKGKVLLIVNTASECGFTPQYAGLETLYKKQKSKGFEILGFPSNDFGGQEPGTDAEIKKFCEAKFKVTFPMFSKQKVKGEADPLYAFLQNEGKAEVKWNFGKFLIGKDGKVLKFFSSNTEPGSDKLAEAIEDALKVK